LSERPLEPLGHPERMNKCGVCQEIVFDKEEALFCAADNARLNLLSLCKDCGTVGLGFRGGHHFVCLEILVLQHEQGCSLKEQI